MTAEVSLLHGRKVGGIKDRNLGFFFSRNGKDLWALSAFGQSSNGWHNSANLLNLEDGSGELLGMMHMHHDLVPGFSEWSGSSYTHRFFIMSSEAPFEMKRVSQHFCFQDPDGRCESVQFVMSLLHLTGDRVLISLGVNDCESRLVTMPINDILKMLVQGPQGALDVIKVPMNMSFAAE